MIALGQPSPTASGLVYSTVWFALLCYPAGLLVFLTSSQRSQNLARLFWTAGCLSFWLHSVSAFATFYQWSMATALSETARQTATLTGFESGSGLYLNFLFAILWAADAVWWWTNPQKYLQRSNRALLWVHGFFLFMILNGAVIFVDNPRRWLGLAIMVVSTTALWLAVNRRRLR